MKNNRLIKIIISLLCCIVVITIAIIIAIHLNNKNDSNNLSNEHYISLDYGFTDVKVTDEKSALEAINTVSDIIGINDVNKELKAQRVDTIDNTTFYRFQQYYNDIPVYGKSINMAVDSYGQVIGLTSNYKSIEIAIKKSKIPINTESVIYDDKLCSVSYNNDGLETYIVFTDIINGKVIKSYDLSKENITINNGTVLNNTLELSGSKDKENNYYLIDDKRNIKVFSCYDVENMNVEKDILTNTNLEATKAFQSVQTIYDYYKKNIGINSFDNKNSSIIVGICTKKVLKDQAKSSLVMTQEHSQELGGNVPIGSGVLFTGQPDKLFTSSLTNSLDIIAHEYTHRVVGNIVILDNLGIDEGVCDIMGNLIELSEGSTNSENVWQLGENSGYSKYNMADNYTMDAYNDNDDGHDNASIISHAAYLMWNGIDGTEKHKITPDKLVKLWYHSLFFMQSDATFSQCRNAVELSARIFLKNGELTQEQYQCVIESFDEVGIENAPYTYYYLVKNDFNLRVLNSKEADDVNFNLKVYKPSETELMGAPALVFEENSLYGNKMINLDDGVYYLEITDLDENAKNPEPITIKIIVDGDDKNAVDEVTVRTDFSDITTVALNEEEKTSKKLKITDFLGLEFGNLISTYGENYDICDAEGWIPSSPSGERMVGYKNIPFSFLVWTGRNEPLIPYENDEITDVMFTKSLSTENYSIDGKINTDITWLELQNKTAGTKWIDGQYYAYSYKIEDPLGDISVIFQYENIPNENSIADYIILTEYFDVAEEDWSTSILYQPIIEKYRSKCEKNHSDYSSVVCCTWFLFDVDNNGVDELIVQDAGAEQAKYHHYYTIKDNKVTELGEYNAWHMGLYEEDGSLFGKVVSPNGPTELYKISIVDNKVEKNLIKTTDDVDYPSYSNPIMPMDISYDINEYN